MRSIFFVTIIVLFASFNVCCARVLAQRLALMETSEDENTGFSVPAPLNSGTSVWAEADAEIRRLDETNNSVYESLSAPAKSTPAKVEEGIAAPSRRMDVEADDAELGGGFDAPLKVDAVEAAVPVPVSARRAEVESGAGLASRLTKQSIQGDSELRAKDKQRRAQIEYNAKPVLNARRAEVKVESRLTSRLAKQSVQGDSEQRAKDKQRRAEAEQLNKAVVNDLHPLDGLSARLAELEAKEALLEEKISEYEGARRLLGDGIKAGGSKKVAVEQEDLDDQELAFHILQEMKILRRMGRRRSH